MSTRERTVWPRGLVIATVLSLSVGLAATFHAATAQQGTKVAPPSAVAVVDLGLLAEKLQEAEVERGRLEAEEKRRQTELDQIVNRLKDAQSRFEMLPKDDAAGRFKIRAEMSELEVHVKVRRELLKQGLDIEGVKVTRGLYVRMMEAIDRVAKREGYDLVLVNDSYLLGMLPAEVSTPQSAENVQRIVRERRVLFASPRIDLTERLISEMNNEYRARAGKP